MSRRSRIAAAAVVLGGALTYVTAPIWYPAVAVGRTLHTAGRGVVRFANRHPHHTTALLTAAFLSYGIAKNERAVDYARLAANQTYAAITERVERKEANDLERIVESPSAPPAREPTVVPLRMREESDYVFYFTKPGDTLSGISSLVSGSEAHYPTIIEDNGIADPAKLAAGQLLRLRKEICTKYSDRVFRRVPQLESVVLSGERISDRFPQNWEEVLAFNRDLGLPYDDAYRGTRVVYHRP